MEDIDKRIDEYSGLFDLYIEGKPIPPEYKDDPVAGYIEEICQDSGNKELCRKRDMERNFQKGNYFHVGGYIACRFHNREGI